MPMAAKSKALRKRSLSLALSRASAADFSGFSPLKSAKATKASRHATAPAATETLTPKKRTPAEARSAAAKAAELPTTCQKKARTPSRQGDRLMRYEIPSVVTAAWMKESESTATPAAVSAAAESASAGMS